MTSPKKASWQRMVIGILLFSSCLGVTLAIFSPRFKGYHPFSLKKESQEEFPFYAVIGQPEPTKITAAGEIRLGKYVIEAKKTNNKQEAQTWQKHFENYGFSAFYTPYSQQGHIVYKVKLGLFSEKDEATMELARLKSELGIDGALQKL